MNLEQSELLRIQRYNEGWRFYFGKHWLFKREDGEPLVTLNYFRKIIDKCVEFMVAKGFVVTVPEALEETTKPFIDEVWEYNKKLQFSWDAATMGSVTGDVFALITFEEPTLMQKRVNPFSQGQIRINLLGSEQVYPTWDPLNTDTLIAVRVETIYYAERGTRQLDREDRVNHEGRQLHTKRFTQIITRDQIVEQYHGDQPLIRPNALGEIPLVHIKNMSLPKEYYGLSDGFDLIDVQRELNEKSTNISDVINYHCVDGETEILTRRGWLRYDRVQDGDEALCLDPHEDEISWSPVERVHVYEHAGSLVRWDNRVDALTTENHRWLAERRIGRIENRRYERHFVRTAMGGGGEFAAADLGRGSRIILGGGDAVHFPDVPTFDDEFVETVGWFVTEGCLLPLPSGNAGIILSQSITANPWFVESIRKLQAYWLARGGTFTEQKQRKNGVICWYVGVDTTNEILRHAPKKVISPEFLCALTKDQAELLLCTLIDADGTRVGDRSVWYQDNDASVDSYQMLSAMVGGFRTRAFKNVRGDGVVDTYKTRTIEILSTVNRAKNVPNASGVVWCPTVKTGVWFARRNGNTYWTGNSAPTTMIFGAKAKQLEKGPRAIWSGLPSTARVEVLRMQGELTESREYIRFVKTALHELSDVPEGALGAMQPISNTSGVALHIQYQPLIGKVRRKKAQYEPGFEQINYFILRIGQTQGLIALPYDLCFAPGTPVRTRDGWRSIENVAVGDEVLTHEGRWREVTSAFPSPRRGRRVFSLRAVGDVDPLVVTEEHPFFVVRKEELCEYVGGPVRWKDVESLSPSWVNVDDIRVGDYVCCPVDVDEVAHEDINVHVARLLGYYAAEGCIQTQRSGAGKKGSRVDNVAVRWSLHEDETWIADQIREDAAACGFREPRVYRDEKRHALYVVIYDKRLVSLCIEHVGRGSYTKSLSQAVLQAPLDQQLAFVGAYLNGDGSQDGVTGQVRYASASRLLAEHVRLLLLRQGVWTTLHVEREKYFYGSIGANQLAALVGVSKYRCVDGAQESHRCRMMNGWLYRPVTRVEDVENPPELFFNLSVDEDESYTVGLTTVHNCKQCGGRIVEVSTGETTKIWEPTIQGFVDVPIRKKRCYNIDKQTFEFTDPFDMRLKYWRAYGFGEELKEFPYRQINEEIERQKRSFWDYTVLQERAMDAWRAKNSQLVDSVAMGEAGTQMAVGVKPKVVEPPPMLVTRKLPDGEVDVPEEPEMVDIVRTWMHPETGAIAHEETLTRFLVPTGCRRPSYMNPFTNRVEFQDVLPKDEALQAQLYAQYQTNGWVDAHWVQSKIPEIAVDATEIRRRMKPQLTMPQGMKPSLVTQSSPVVTAQYSGELAPRPEGLATVPGEGGNPVPMIPSSQEGG